MHRSGKTLAIGVVMTATVMGGLVWLRAAERNSSGAATKPAARSVDLFAGMDSGDLVVKLIPKNDQEATVMIENKTNQPVSVKLPEAFVGVPVLAQQRNGGGGRNTNRNTNNNQNQTLGGGLGGGGGGGLGGGGFGGGGFNVAPEAVGKFKVPVVCLEHGKEDPAARIPYELRPVETFTKDNRVISLLAMMGEGNLNQRAVQAAAWHFANGMSWDELDGKRIHHLGGRPDEKYFSVAEMQLAARIASEAERVAKLRPPVKDKEVTRADADAPANGDTVIKSPGDKQ